MKTSTILQAIAILTEAEKALKSGSLDVSAQVLLGCECWSVAFDLRQELAKDVPAVQVAEAA